MTSQADQYVASAASKPLPDASAPQPHGPGRDSESWERIKRALYFAIAAKLIYWAMCLLPDDPPLGKGFGIVVHRLESMVEEMRRE